MSAVSSLIDTRLIINIAIASAAAKDALTVPVFTGICIHCCVQTGSLLCDHPDKLWDKGLAHPVC
jgi:hypothetical protein